MSHWRRVRFFLTCAYSNFPVLFARNKLVEKKWPYENATDFLALMKCPQCDGSKLELSYIPLILVAKDFLLLRPDKTSFSSVLFLSLSSINTWTPPVPDVESSG